MVLRGFWNFKLLERIRQTEFDFLGDNSLHSQDFEWYNSNILVKQLLKIRWTIGMQLILPKEFPLNLISATYQIKPTKRLSFSLPSSDLFILAKNKMCSSLAELIKWSDAVLLYGDSALDRTNVSLVVSSVKDAVEVSNFYRVRLLESIRFVPDCGWN